MSLDLNAASIATSLMIIATVALLWYWRWSEKNSPKRKTNSKKVK
jgi:hypothetical protein